MNGDVLKLFEGLTEKQVRKLRAAIIPTLQKLRDEITQDEKVTADARPLADKKGAVKMNTKNSKSKSKKQNAPEIQVVLNPTGKASEVMPPKDVLHPRYQLDPKSGKEAEKKEEDEK